MTDFYSDMAAVAAELLAPTSAGGLGQGSIVLVRFAPGPPPVNSWDAPSDPVRTETPLNGAARGVSKELIGTPVENTSVVATDLQVIVAPWGGAVEPADVLELDGSAVTILSVSNVPAVGITAAVRFLVRQ